MAKKLTKNDKKANKDEFIIFKFRSDNKRWGRLKEKLSLASELEDKYYLNKLPTAAAVNKKYKILIAAISEKDNRLYFGSAEPYRNNKLLIENTYRLSENKEKAVAKLIKAESEKELFELEADSKSALIYIQDLNREKFNQILNSDLQLKPELSAGKYKTFKEEKKNRTIRSLESNLHPLAQKSRDARRAVGIHKPDPMRGEFERDRDRLIHSRSFRRLVGKAQVYNTDKGDHYRTRMTHTLEVSQIAKSIARNLSLNEDLAEAAALGHDIGHTPFGHQGERQLDKSYKKRINANGDLIKFKHNYQSLKVLNYLEEKYKSFPGLDLSYQVYEAILKHTNFKLCGKKRKCSGCSHACIDNYLIIGNSKYLYLDYDFPVTLEGQIIYWADEIAQAEHDLDDGLSNGTINLAKLERELTTIIESFESDSTVMEKEHLEALRDIVSKYRSENLEKYRSSKSEFIDQKDLIKSEIVLEVTGFFVNKIIEISTNNMEEYLNKLNNGEIESDAEENIIKTKVIGLNNLDSLNSEMSTNVIDTFNDLISSQVINSYEVNCFDGKAEYIIRKLFAAYYTNPLQLPDNTLHRIDREIKRFDKSWNNIRVGDSKKVKEQLEVCVGEHSSTNSYQDQIKRRIFIKTIVDFIAGMTDDFAKSQFNKLYLP